MAGHEAIVAVQGFNPEHPELHKVLRIVGSRDGSYSISAPYHPATSGILQKFRLPDGVSLVPHPAHQRVKPIQLDRYRVDTRVKLSFHASGFVQFSSVGRRPIRSGRTKLLVPRGLGIHSNSLLDPIDTGPTWMATFHNISECEPVHGTERVPVLVFGPGDFFERDDHDQVGRHVFRVETFTFPFERRREAILGRRGWTLRTGYGLHRPEWVTDFQIFDLAVSVAFLGITVSVQHGPPDLHGGYDLGSPKDLVTGAMLQGSFPGEGWATDEEDIPSMRYAPEAVSS